VATGTNRLAHYRTTGPEIWEQTAGEVTAFVSSVGTGGTLAGVASYLKERSAQVAAVCADSYGAAMWSSFTNGNTETKDGDSYAEGTFAEFSAFIGNTRREKRSEAASHNDQRSSGSGIPFQPASILNSSPGSIPATILGTIWD